jgi:hypothetical protein
MAVRAWPWANRAFYALAALGVGLLSGCGKVLEYPDPELEQSALLCNDGIDNDYDGLADCEDARCDGFCSEESARTCGDGRDNDGDGLTDAADPRCWLSRAPQAASCSGANGVNFVETFDTIPVGPVTAPWWAEGTLPASGECVVCVEFRDTTGRLLGVPGRLENGQDPAAMFFYNTTGADRLDRNLGVLVRREAFAGSFENFELTFTAAIQPQTLLRAAFVPIELAPAFESPQNVEQKAALSLTLDATGTTPELTLEVGGVPFAKPLPFTQGFCDETLCNEFPLAVRLTLEESGFVAQVSYPDGAEVELTTPRPTTSRLAPSRLVFSGGSAVPSNWVLLDDVRVRVSPELPCGIAVPEIPGKSCEFSERLSSFGHGVSVARAPDGEYCALVTASRDAGAGPEVLSTWRSADAENWTVASDAIELPEHATLIGGGIAADGEGLRAAVAYRLEGGVSAGVTTAKRCGQWEPLAPGPDLALDAEAPSSVLAGGQPEIYFTRPPGALATRSLWRASEGEPVLVASLPAGVGAPVSVVAAGERDLVLVYPLEGAGNAGIGLLVGAPGASVWQSVAGNPVLDLGPSLGQWDGRIRFDDRGVAAATLSFGAGGGFLLYAGRTLAPDRRSADLFDTASLLGVGTAWFAAAGQVFPDLHVVPVPRCGNETCDAEEDCTLCEADCPCLPGELLVDGLAYDRWRPASNHESTGRSQYLVEDPSTLYVTGGEATWGAMLLETALSGDFELSFDLSLSEPVSEDPCTLYLGVGGMPPLLRNSSGSPDATESAIFARIALSAYCGGVTYSVTPVVQTEERRFGEPEPPPATPVDCAQYLEPNVWQHVVLRRVNSRVSVLVPRRDGCGTLEHSLTYAGEASLLAAILAGHGDGGFESCAPGAWGATIENLKLRLLNASEPCAEGRADCSSDAELAGCIDLTSSAEHCGTCGRRCEANQECRNGRCVCSDLAGVLECDGACVDSLASPDHCGGCDAPCPGRCLGGVCDPVLGDCDAPLAVESAGESLMIDFFRQGSSGGLLCKSPVYKQVVLVWTPRESGRAYVELDRGGAVIGVSESEDCDWRVCPAASEVEERTSQDLRSLSFPVEAGKTYRIGLGRRLPAGEGNAEALVKVGFE